MTKTSRKTSRKPHAETTKDPRFNEIANAAHCHLLNGCLTQSLSNNKLRLLFGFFAFRLFTKASFRHSLKTKKPLNLR
jgi:hypothetical protein